LEGNHFWSVFSSLFKDSHDYADENIIWVWTHSNVDIPSIQEEKQWPHYKPLHTHTLSPTCMDTRTHTKTVSIALSPDVPVSVCSQRPSPSLQWGMCESSDLLLFPTLSPHSRLRPTLPQPPLIHHPSLCLELNRPSGTLLGEARPLTHSAPRGSHR
jgi:hypothetical protein